MNTNAIFNIQSREDFNSVAFQVFDHQFKNCKVYRSFCHLLNVHPSDITSICEIPFLPVEFFKSHKIVSLEKPVEEVFSSSGTTGSFTSKHHITDIAVYRQSFLTGFEHFYGDVSNYTILALLPSYLERNGSSLIYMVNDLINRSKKQKSGFYLDNYDALRDTLLQLEENNEKVLLIGVSFALLDLVEQYEFDLNHTIVMETGGMKGRRKELIRKELHEILTNGFGVQQIHSEYGMTELLSQAYSKGDGIFTTPPWMKILIRNSEDPLEILDYKKTGGINVIDLANINSCSFIATQDLGKTYANDTFEVLGRFDHSDIRGCNLLIS